MEEKNNRECNETMATQDKENRMRPEGPDFLLEYRAHPERYRPLAETQYKHFDEWEDQIVRNLCWSAGLLEENRPYFAEFWKVFGVTTLTITVSAKGAEPAEILRMILKAGLIVFKDHEKARIQSKRIKDDDGNEFIGMNFVFGTENDEYAEGYLTWMEKAHRFDELNALNEKENNTSGDDDSGQG